MGFNNPLTPAQLAAAIASTTLTVTGSVNTTPTTPTPGTDPDTLRVLDQPAINALSAADKSTPFVIYNTTTSAINYVVNGNVVVPTTTGPTVKTGTYTGDAGTGLAVAVGFAPDVVFITAQSFVAIVEGTQSRSLTSSGVGNPQVVCTATGFTTGPGTAVAQGMNNSGTVYTYTAIKGA